LKTLIAAATNLTLPTFFPSNCPIKVLTGAEQKLNIFLAGTAPPQIP